MEVFKRLTELDNPFRNNTPESIAWNTCMIKCLQAAWEVEHLRPLEEELQYIWNQAIRKEFDDYKNLGLLNNYD